MLFISHSKNTLPWHESPEGWDFKDDKVSFQKHLARLKNLDLALDNPFFGGGSTLMNSVSIGVPVVTIKGSYLGSYSGENMMNNNHLKSFVAKNFEHYEKKAVEILKSKKTLIKTKKKFKLISNKLPQIWKKNIISFNKSLISLNK